MKVTMINDCSFVGENIVKFLPTRFDVTHIKRTRGFYSKTVGVFWKILRASGDVFHTHYLLQDSYLTLRLKKQDRVIAHAHGSDVRSTLDSKKWGWIVRYCLKHATKILLSSADVLQKARKFRSDVEFISIPVNLDVFVPQSFEKHDGIVIFCPYMKYSRGTDKVIRCVYLLEKAYPQKSSL